MKNESPGIELILYEDQYAADFKRLNLEWLEKYHLAEELDLQVLNDPRGMILDTGGIIFLAKSGNEIVGSAALIKEHDHDDVYELAKMAVDVSQRGKGIGNLLIEKCLQNARDRKATKVTLYSNSQLKVAISMYEKYGFQHADITHSPFVTADVYMELVL